MAVTRKHIPLTIVRPGVEEIFKVDFLATADQDAQINIIPYRYPFADIANHAALKAANFFRHENSTAVDTSIGGSATANTRTTLGYQLPPTEKLVLLVKVTTALTADKFVEITVAGSKKYGIDDIKYKVHRGTSAGSDLEVTAGDVFEIDLYNFGLLLDANGEIVITTEAENAADDAKLSFGLVARTL